VCALLSKELRYFAGTDRQGHGRFAGSRLAVAWQSMAVGFDDCFPATSFIDGSSDDSFKAITAGADLATAIEKYRTDAA
jgi:hypothetical protein